MSFHRSLSILIPIALLTPAACGSDDSDANGAGAPSKGGTSGSAGKASGGASGSSSATGGKGNATGGTSNGAGKGGTSASGGSISGGAAGDGSSAMGGTGSSEAGAAGESNAGAATGGSSGTGGSGGSSSDDPCAIPEAVGSCAMLNAHQCSEYYKDYPLADACVQSGGEWADGPCPRDDLVAYCLNQFPEDDRRTLGAFYYAENPAYQVACGGDASWCLAK